MSTISIAHLGHDNRPADHDSEGNLVIEIDVDKNTCHAQEEEHTGSGKRKVHFKLTKDHELYFSNKDVFGITATPKGKNHSLDVAARPTPPDKVVTAYSLDPSLQDLTAPNRGDPRIVVP